MGFLSKVFGGVLDLFGSIFESVLGWLAPEVDVEDKEGLTISRQGSDISIPVVYGTREVGGIVVDKFVTDKSGGLENELLHMLVVFSMGEVDAIEELYFDDYSENDPRYSKKRGGKWFSVESRLGGSDNLIPVNATGKLENFSASTSLYEGLCFAFITFEVTDKERIWRGEPQVKARIRGKKCFDWRTNQTAYTENPAVQLVDYIKNPIYGKAVADEDINYEYFTDVANRCDIIESSNTVTENRSYYDRELRRYINLPPFTTTVDFKRFTSNTIIDTSKEVFSNIKELVNTFRGYFPEPDGRIAVASEDVSPAVYHFDADNILDGIKRKTTTKNDRFNRVVVRFPNLKNRYEKDEVFYPPQGDPLFDEWLQEDGTVLEKTLQTDTIVYKAEALQLAEVAAKISRNSDSIEFSTTLDAAILDVGDVITVSDDTRGWDSVEFRVSYIKVRDDGVLDISAILYNETVYPWQPKAYEEDIGGIFIGDPTNIPAPADLNFTVDETFSFAGKLTWSYNSDAFLSEFEVEIEFVYPDGNFNPATQQITDDEGNVLAENVDFDPETLEIILPIVFESKTRSKSLDIPRLDVGTYRFNVYAISTLGTRSANTVLQVNFNTPLAPDDLLFDINDWSIECRPFYASGFVAFGTRFEFDVVAGDGLDYEPTPRFDGSTYTITGLIPENQYTFYVRAINAYGVSDWFSKSATTTASAEQLDPFLSPIKQDILDFSDRIGTFDEEFANIDISIDGIDTSISDINSSIDGVNTSIGGITSDIGGINDDIQDINSKVDDVDVDIRFQNKIDEIDRELGELELLRSVIDGVNFTDELTRRLQSNEQLTGALISVDPETGTITNKAFDYADEKFTQAGILIDGVEGQIQSTTQQLEATEDTISNLTTEINQVDGKITQTVNAVFAENITALQPAEAFNFFDSAQGWVAVNGSLTENLGSISLTLGDIENSSLDYPAEDNPLIRFTITRTGGSGFVGSVVITRTDDTTETFNSVIEDIALGVESSRSIDFRGSTNYSGQIKSVRIILGVDDTDTFDISSLTIGKPDSALIELDNLTSRVVQAENSIDANEAEIKQRVTLTEYNGNAVTLSNVETVINGLDSYISLTATRQELDDNDTVVKANQASIDIDALSGTVTALTQTQNENFTTVSTELDSVNGTLTDSLYSINLNKSDDELEALAFLLNEIRNGADRVNEIEKGVVISDAVNQIKVDISDEGSLAQDIQQLTSFVNTVDTSLLATADQLTQTKADVEGNASAINQLELDVTDLSTDLSATINRVNAVEIDADDNAQAISSIEGAVNNPTTGLTASYNLAQQAKTDADGNGVAINQLKNLVEDEDSGVAALNLLFQSAEIDIDNNATAIQVLENSVNNPTTGLSATNTLAQSALSSADDNATAIQTLENSVNNPTTGLSATNTLAQQAQIDADDNATAIQTLENSVNNPTTGLSATNSLAQGAKNDADDNATAIQTLENQVNNATTGLSATNTLAQQAKIDADDNATAIQTLENSVNDPETGLSATNTLAQQAQIDADDNANAITSLSARVDDNEDFADAQLILNSNYDSDLDQLNARAFLGVDVNGRVTGININGSDTNSTIDFIGNKVRFLNPTNLTPAFTWNSQNATFDFTGQIFATSGTLGTMTTSSTGFVRTGDASTSGIRVVINAPNANSEFAIWVGNGSQTEQNATFFIKKDGTGFIKGEFFQGEIIESKFATAQSSDSPISAEVTHNSEGKVVELTTSFSTEAIFNGDSESEPRQFKVELFRNGSLVKTRTYLARGIFFINTTTYSFDGSFTYFDETTSTGNRSYSAKLTILDTPSGTYNLVENSISLKTFENKLG